MYSVDGVTGDIVVGGFDKGIGDSPYSGLTDERNVNIISVPGEASVNFATSKISSGAITGSVTSVSSSICTFTGGIGVEDYIAIYFTGVGSYTGISLATPYWVTYTSGATFTLYADYEKTTAVTITGTGTATFVAYQIGKIPSYITGATSGPIKYFAQPQSVAASSYSTFGVDGLGLVWSNMKTTGLNSYWTYTGNSVLDGNGNPNASGNGLVYWRVKAFATGSQAIISSTDYVFVFRNSQIDYFIAAASGVGAPAVGVWTYGWNPDPLNFAASGASNYLNVAPGTDGSHDAIIDFNGQVFFCDGTKVWKFYQALPTVIFAPGTLATFSSAIYNLLPTNDLSQCLTQLGTNMLIGGQGYFVYQWDKQSQTVNLQFPIAEPFIAHMVTVNTNAYIFAGNRGRIFLTNGSQAQLWAKIPDHISGTVEPRFDWGGACSVKNQMYCSVNCTDNTGNSITAYGGVWAIDLDTKAIRLSNRLSYGTYAGYSSAMIQQIYNPTTGVYATGLGLLVGWDSGASTYGIDQPALTPYTDGQAYVISDFIPVGTYLQPTTPTQFEYKLAMPLLASETVELQVGASLSDFTNGTFTSLGTTTGSASKVILSDIFPNKIQLQQWCLVKCILTAKASSPSYNRLTQLRIKGATVSQTSTPNIQ